MKDFFFNFRSILVAAGIYSFVLSKRSIDRSRYENMKIRERMRNANTGNYIASERKFTG